MISVVFGCLCLALPGQVQAFEPQDDFQQGVSAFRDGDHELARAHFQRARDAGDRRPVLTYNLAVTHYRLGRYTESERLFRELTRYPDWRELSEYNLGLIAMRREARAQDRKPRFAVLSAGFGMDDNMIAFPGVLQADAALGEDSYIDVLAYGQATVHGDHRNGVRLTGMGFARRHNEFDFLDVNVVSAGGILDRSAGEWQLEYGAAVTHTAVDGVRLTNETQLRLGARRQLGAGTVRFRYLPAYHAAGSEFQELDGVVHRFDTRWRQRAGPLRLTLAYRFESHHRDDRAIDGEFFSYSPVRNRLGLQLDWQATYALSVEAGASGQRSRYRGINRFTDIDDEILEARRTSDRTEGWLKLGYAPGPRSMVSAELRHTVQDDTFRIYEYDSTAVVFNMEFTF